MAQRNAFVLVLLAAIPNGLAVIVLFSPGAILLLS
jgi:hypothetical protein